MAVSEYSIELDGVDLGAAPYNIYVLSGEPPIMPEPRLFERRKATANGSIIQGSSYEAARWTLSCACTYPAGSGSTVLTAIAAAFQAATSEALSFRIGWRADEVWQVRVSSMSEPDRRGNGALFSVSFVAENPIPTEYEE